VGYYIFTRCYEYKKKHHAETSVSIDVKINRQKMFGSCRVPSSVHSFSGDQLRRARRVFFLFNRNADQVHLAKSLNARIGGVIFFLAARRCSSVFRDEFKHCIQQTMQER
jgi:hypothetical protein